MEKRVTIEKNGELYRVIGAYYNNKEIIRVEEIVESRRIEIALSHFYRLNPEWINVIVEENY
jgi:hypothetical protein